VRLLPGQERQGQGQHQKSFPGNSHQPRRRRAINRRWPDIENDPPRTKNAWDTHLQIPVPETKCGKNNTATSGPRPSRLRKHQSPPRRPGRPGEKPLPPNRQAYLPTGVDEGQLRRPDQFARIKTQRPAAIKHRSRNVSDHSAPFAPRCVVPSIPCFNPRRCQDEKRHQRQHSPRAPAPLPPACSSNAAGSEHATVCSTVRRRTKPAPRNTNPGGAGCRVRGPRRSPCRSGPRRLPAGNADTPVPPRNRTRRTRRFCVP